MTTGALPRFLCAGNCPRIFFIYFKEGVVMFDNIGKKIKLLASVLCWVGIIAYVIVAIIMIVVGMVGSDILIGLGLIFLFVGPLISWISSFFMYGFGELIDKVGDIERNTRGGERKSVAQARKETERIEKLERLRSKNLITEEEYQQALAKEEN